MILNNQRKFDQPLFLLGYGFWGKKLYSAFRQLGYEVVVFDVESKKVEGVEVHSINDLDDYLSKHSHQHFFIATPEQTHFDLAKKILLSSNHVFVEKPLALSKDESQELVDIATKKKVNLFVDHVFLYDEGWSMVKEFVSQLGVVKKITSVRHSNNIFKSNLSVFDDLAPHDIYLFNDFFHEFPTGQTINILKKKQDQIIDAKLVWNIKNITWKNWYSWNTYPTERTFSIIGEKGRVVWKKGERGDVLEVEIDGRTQILPVVKQRSPLELMIEDFFQFSKQESSRERGQRYSSYVQEVGVLESIRDASSTL